MADYDIKQIFADMEQDLIASYYRNMSRHAQDEIVEGFSWEMWQQKKLQDLSKFQQESRRIVDKIARQTKNSVTGELEDSFSKGVSDTNAIVKGVGKKIVEDSFGRTNRRKLDSLIDAIHNDFDRAGVAALRLVDDEYRKIVFKAQVMFNSGATSLGKAIDLAAKDFLQAGINCIQYKNGNKVNIASYAEMVLRTSSKKSYLTGEGARNNELGVHLVQITSYGGCSPLCLPWQGKVFVDDVYSGGVPDGEHQLLSFAMSNGLFHPHCRHTSGPYFEGISYAPTDQNEENIKKTYAAEQKQRAIERKIREWKRVQEGSIDPENKARAGAKVRAWQSEMRSHLDENPFLTRKYSREKTFGIPANPTSVAK